MKFGQLRAIGHNIADSLADGHGFLIGLYYMDIFGEADRVPERYIEVNFLTGTWSGRRPSDSLAKAFRLYAEALPAFCGKHGVPRSAFRELSVRFLAGGPPRLYIVKSRIKQGDGGRTSIRDFPESVSE